MASVTESVDVGVPVRTAYDQWTQFESFPNFMTGVKEVRQLDDTHLRWVVDGNGQTAEWEAVVTEQVPDQRIAWKSTSGQPNAGVVTFHRLGPDKTRVTVQLEWQPQGTAEDLGDALGVDDRRVRVDLGDFKRFVEERSTATGAWRGEVDQTHTG